MSYKLYMFISGTASECLYICLNFSKGRKFDGDRCDSFAGTCDLRLGFCIDPYPGFVNYVIVHILTVDGLKPRNTNLDFIP